MVQLEIHQFTCRRDNFGVLVHDPATGETASIDAPEEGPIRQALAEKGWTLSVILVTHHHMDHVEAIPALKAATGCRVIGPRQEAGKIPELDQEVADGDRLTVCGTDVEVISTPGHTLGQVAYHFPQAHVAFTGDTLFAMGCGRVFEGTMEQMWGSLDRLRGLPPKTAIYCGHEYTLSNARFAVTVDPDNEVLKERLAEVERLRQEGRATLPTTIGAELATNPFLRADDPGVQAAVGMSGAPPAAVFAEVRRRKDAA